MFCKKILLFYIILFELYKCDVLLEESALENTKIYENIHENVIDMRGTVFKAAKNFFCSIDDLTLTDPVLLLYGSKAWNFPLQDVNLTLNYPAYNSSSKEFNENHIITMMRVILLLDGGVSRAFISNGGMLRDHMTATFLLNNTSVLGYHFWLYGVNRTVVTNVPYNLLSNQCRN